MNLPSNRNPFTTAVEIVHGYQSNSGDQHCDARDLHGALGVRRDFSTWFKDRVEQYRFIEGEDFSPNLGKSIGGRPATNYLITVDMAKELAMIENNEIGRRIRRYFIEAEKKARELLIEQANQVQPIEQVKERIKDTGKFKYLLILQEQSRTIAKALANETDHAERYNLHCQLRQVNEALGIPTMPLETMALPKQ